MWTTETVDLNGPDRRRAGLFVQLRKERNRSSRSGGPSDRNREERCSSGLNARRQSCSFRSTVSIVHIPHTPGSSRQALVFRQRSWFRYIPVATKSLQPFAQPPGSSDPRGRPPAPTSGRARPRATRSHVPRSQRLRRRRLASCSVSLPHSFSPSGWNGECIRGLGCAGPGEPATDLNSGTRDSLPFHGRSAASAFGASASGAAPSALSASGASVSRPISRVQCRVISRVQCRASPLHPSDSAPSLCSARCLPAISTS